MAVYQTNKRSYIIFFWLEIIIFAILISTLGLLRTLGLTFLQMIIGIIFLISFIYSNTKNKHKTTEQVAYRTIDSSNLLYIIAGIGLITPGFLTFTIGLLIFISDTVKEKLWKYLVQQVTPQTNSNAKKSTKDKVFDLSRDDYTHINNSDDESKK